MPGERPSAEMPPSAPVQQTTEGRVKDFLAYLVGVAATDAVARGITRGQWAACTANLTAAAGVAFDVMEAKRHG